ncbi:MAG: MFS transporter [Verrucomicrobiota bacterium]
MSNESSGSKPPVVPAQYLLPFILTTCCFSLWGFANDFTNPLVKVYEQVFIISTSQATLLQFAFYTGYFCMALPAAFFIRRFSYKAAIMVGFAFYALGALLAIPASLTATFMFFVVGSYILTYGLAFLETACNPYILSMGDPATATQRLNLAQAFNPVGSIVGMIVASQFLAPSLMVSQFRDDIKDGKPEVVQYLITEEAKVPEGASLNKEAGTITFNDENADTVTFYADGLPDLDTEVGALGAASTDALKAFRATDPDGFQQLQQTDLGFVRMPYIIIASVVIVFLVIFAFVKMPVFQTGGKDAPFGDVCRRIFAMPRFREGVFAQLFYVGAQIMCWTFIVHYGMEQVGLTLGQAQTWNIVAMVIFLSSRWICTLLLRFFNPGALLGIFAIGGIVFCLGTIYLKGEIFTVSLFGNELAANSGLLSLVLISACMSLMFPTIYGIALGGMKEEESKLGSAFLIMSIVGGAVLTQLQGIVIDKAGVRESFWLPLICFIFIAAYGFRSMARHRDLSSEPHPDYV